MMFSCINIIYHIYIKKALFSDTVLVITGTLFLYPVTMMICWLPLIVNDFVVISTGYFIKRGIAESFICLANLNGFLTSIIFIAKNKEGPLNWKHLLNVGVNNFINDAIEGNETSY
jgi:hypothetical protein